MGSFLRAFASLYSRSSCRSRRRVFRPSLQRLEDRCVPTVVSQSPIAQQIAATVAAGQTLPAKNDNVVLDWNATMLEAIWTDGTQPTVASRTMAMVQVAVYDAVDSLRPEYALYQFPGLPSPPPIKASVDAAAAAAADEVLSNIYPDQTALFSAQLQGSLASIPDGMAKEAGLAFGGEVADAVLAWRANDGSNATSNYQPAAPGTDPGVYELTPPKYAPAVSPQWGGVTPFAMKSANQFLPPGPPALDTINSAADFNITKALGGTTSTLRTSEQTNYAHFWADLAGKSVTPPGHWNEIAEQMCYKIGLDVVQTARVFALLDIGQADAAISCWGAKYLYNSWRPVTAINYASLANNPLMVQDSTWAPLWDTPAFPEYTSGHSTFSGAAASILTGLFGANLHFTIGSDNLPGYTRSFTSFQQAAEEAGMSRVVGGIHFMSANLDGLQAGRELGDYVFAHFLSPLHNGRGARMAAPKLAKQHPPACGSNTPTYAQAWREAWALAVAIVDQSGATMTWLQQAELTVTIAIKLETVIALMPLADFPAA